MASCYDEDEKDPRREDFDEDDPLPFVVHQTLKAVSSQIKDDDSVLTPIQLEKRMSKSRERKIRQIAADLLADDSLSIESSLHGRPMHSIALKPRNGKSFDEDEEDHVDTGARKGGKNKDKDFEEFQEFAHGMMKAQRRKESSSRRNKQQNALSVVRSLENFLPSSIARHFRESDDTDDDSSDSSSSGSSFSCYPTGYFFTDSASASADGTTDDGSTYDESGTQEQPSLLIPTDNSLLSDSSFRPRARGNLGTLSHAADELRRMTASNAAPTPGVGMAKASLASSPDRKRDDNSVKTEDAWDNVEITIQDVTSNLLGDEGDVEPDDDDDAGLLYTDAESNTKNVRWKEQDSPKASKKMASGAEESPSNPKSEQDVSTGSVNSKASKLGEMTTDSKSAVHVDGLAAEIKSDSTIQVPEGAVSSLSGEERHIPTVETVYSLESLEDDIEDEVSKVEEMFPQLRSTDCQSGAQRKSEKSELSTSKVSEHNEAPMNSSMKSEIAASTSHADEKISILEGKNEEDLSEPDSISNPKEAATKATERQKASSNTPDLELAKEGDACSTLDNDDPTHESKVDDESLEAPTLGDGESENEIQKDGAAKIEEKEKEKDDSANTGSTASPIERSLHGSQDGSFLEEDTTIVSTMSREDTLSSSVLQGSEKGPEEAVSILEESIVSTSTGGQPTASSASEVEDIKSIGDESDAETCNSEDTVKTGTTSLYSRMSVKSRNRAGTHEDSSVLDNESESQAVEIGSSTGKNDKMPGGVPSILSGSTKKRHRKSRSQRRIELITKHLTQELHETEKPDFADDTDSKFSVSVDEGSGLHMDVEEKEEDETSVSFSQISVDPGMPIADLNGQKSETEFDDFLETFLAVKNETVSDLEEAKNESQLDDFLQNILSIKIESLASQLFREQAATDSKDDHNHAPPTVAAASSENADETAAKDSAHKYYVKTEGKDGSTFKTKVSIEAIPKIQRQIRSAQHVKKERSSHMSPTNRADTFVRNQRKQQDHPKVAQTYLTSTRQGRSANAISTSPSVFKEWQSRACIDRKITEKPSSHRVTRDELPSKDSVAKNVSALTAQCASEEEQSRLSEDLSEISRLQKELLRVEPSVCHTSKIGQSAYSIALRERGKALMTRMKARREALKSHSAAAARDHVVGAPKPVDHEEELLKFLTRNIDKPQMASSPSLRNRGAMNNSKLKRGSLLMSHFRERENPTKASVPEVPEKEPVATLFQSPPRQTMTDFASTSNLLLFPTVDRDESLTTPPHSRQHDDTPMAFNLQHGVEESPQPREKRLSAPVDFSPMRVGRTSEFDESRFREAFEWNQESLHSPNKSFEPSDPWSQDAAKDWFRDQKECVDDSSRTHFLERLADQSTTSSNCFDTDQRSRHQAKDSISHSMKDKAGSPTSVAASFGVERTSKSSHVYSKGEFDSVIRNEIDEQYGDNDIWGSNSIIESENSESVSENSIIQNHGRKLTIRGTSQSQTENQRQLPIDQNYQGKKPAQYSTNPFDDGWVDEALIAPKHSTGMFGF